VFSFILCPCYARHLRWWIPHRPLTAGKPRPNPAAHGRSRYSYYTVLHSSPGLFTEQIANNSGGFAPRCGRGYPRVKIFGRATQTPTRCRSVFTRCKAAGGTRENDPHREGERACAPRLQEWTHGSVRCKNPPYIEHGRASRHRGRAVCGAVRARSDCPACSASGKRTRWQGTRAGAGMDGRKLEMCPPKYPG